MNCSDNFFNRHKLALGTIGLMALILMSTSCRRLCALEGSGNLLTETRNLSPFSRLQVNGNMNVYIHLDEVSHVTITTDDNIMKHVETNVSGGQLYVDMNTRICGYDYTMLEVHVYTPALNQIKMNGNCDVNAIDTLQAGIFNAQVNGNGNLSLVAACDQLVLKLEGNADAYCYGQANYANYEVNGNGKIDALSFPVTDATAKINGSGEIKLNCTHHLDATITGSGQILYTGGCSVNAHVNGSGEVKPY